MATYLKNVAGTAIFGLLVSLSAGFVSAAGSSFIDLTFDEGSGQVAADNSGNGHDGTLGDSGAVESLDPTWELDGACNSSLSFDGGDYVRVPNDPGLEPATEVTVEAWARSAGSPGSFRYILAKGSSSCSSASYAMYTGGSGGLHFYVTTPSGFTLSPNAGTGVWDGDWHHFVGTYDGTRVRLYVDGVEVGTGSPKTGAIKYALATNNDLLVGAYRGSCFLGWRGGIDEVNVFDFAMTDVEIAERAGDACDDTDADDDGVDDEDDICPETVLPEGVPTVSLKKNHYADVDGDGTLDAGAGTKKPLTVTMADTAGCSCEQIAEALPGNNKGWLKHGCPKGIVENWVNSH